MDTNNYEEGFRLAFENAKRLFKAAEALEKEKEFPIANSLLILAAEEGIKAYTILIKYFLPDKNLEMFKSVFEDHTFKLNVLRGFVLWIELMKKFIEYYYLPALQNLDKPYKEVKKLKSKYIANFVNWAKKDQRDKKNGLLKQLNWWKHAKAMKENGFYVRHNKGKWFVPTAIKKTHYLRTKKYVEANFQILEYLYDLDFNDKSTQEDFSQVKQSMEKIYKEKIEGTLMSTGSGLL